VKRKVFLGNTKSSVEIQSISKGNEVNPKAGDTGTSIYTYFSLQI
jgi:hypothetical protein